MDVESGYRDLPRRRAADALDYYQGYKYSETVEVAVILCRLGYRGPERRHGPGARPSGQHARLVDAAIDLAMIPVAAYRASRRRRRRARR